MCLCALAMACLIVGCGDGSPSSPAPAQTEPAGLRIVTLAPALSQMLVDLDLGDSIVGVSEYDAAAPPGLPVVGNYTAVNTEMLVSTDPTLVLMMVGPAGPPGRVQDLADQGLFELVTFPFPLSTEDIAKVLHDQSPAHGDASAQGPSLGEALGIPQQAKVLKDRMLSQLASIQKLTAGREPPAVLLVIGTRPIMASGPGTVHDELLGFAGAVNAAAGARVTAPQFDRESLLAMAPRVILFLQPDAPALAKDDPRLDGFAGLPIPAIESGRVYVINDPLVLLPSTSIVHICAEMAKAIHPELADEIDRLMEDAGSPADTGHKGQPNE